MKHARPTILKYGMAAWGAGAALAAVWLACAGSAGVFGAFPVAQAATGVNASWYFITPTSSIALGESFSVTLALSTDQPVNAYAFSVQYNGDALRLDDANTANSIITVSPGVPTVQGNGVSYVGGSFTPFLGIAGKVLTLDFTAVATGTDELTFAPSSYAYLANGKGTRVAPQIVAVSITVLPAANAIQGPSANAPGTVNVDTIPPSISSLAFIADPFDQNHKLLSFLIADAGSGIAEMEVRTRSGPFWSGWKIAENPAPIANNVWEADLKITDNAGNVAEEAAYDWPAFVKSAAIWGGALVLAIIIIVFLTLRRRRNAKINR